MFVSDSSITSFLKRKSLPIRLTSVFGDIFFMKWIISIRQRFVHLFRFLLHTTSQSATFDYSCCIMTTKTDKLCCCWHCLTLFLSLMYLVDFFIQSSYCIFRKQPPSSSIPVFSPPKYAFLESTKQSGFAYTSHSTEFSSSIVSLTVYRYSHICTSSILYWYTYRFMLIYIRHFANPQLVLFWLLL